LRIALLAPPMEPVPPPAYAGTERVVAALAEELSARGHHVTLFASGDSTAVADLIPTVPRALWADGFHGDVRPWIQRTIDIATERQADFDVIHSHLETMGLPFAASASVPVVSTLHGRLDVAGIPALLERHPTAPLVAISTNQRRWSPAANWVATIHHGLPLDRIPEGNGAGGHFALVGRATSEKGIAEGIEVARRTGRLLRIAAKVHDEEEVAYLEQVVRPAVVAGTVDFLGEVGPAVRDEVYGGAIATLMLGAWPEPFGLVAIESLAAGTPIIGRRAGALPEIVEHGVDGFLVDDVTEAEHAVSLLPRLDRHRIRERALRRFSVARMVDAYETVYRHLIDERASRHADGPVGADDRRTAEASAGLGARR
jgi:glycosyltransferase involved in cell wall biosynthesis